MLEPVWCRAGTVPVADRWPNATITAHSKEQLSASGYGLSSAYSCMVVNASLQVCCAAYAAKAGRCDTFDVLA